MKKYLSLISVIILIITFFTLPFSDWKLGVAGIVLGLLLAIKAPKGIWKSIAYGILTICILLLLFLVFMGILMSGLVEMD
ncbi:hypothetical protein [Metabacillus fastidiosus]|uniref:hypothetical protein n=1 Tax=Metabacillus fastidiosus TaxID=1458 RepID=UPI003D2C4F99